MKKFTLMLVAGLFALAGSVNAQGTVKCLAADNVFFEEGSTTADLVVKMDYDTENTVCSWGFSLYLPDGISLSGEFEGDTFYPDGSSYSTETNSRGISNKPVDITKRADGGWLIVGYAAGNPDMKSTHGTLVTLSLTGSTSVSGDASIKSISVSSVKVEGHINESVSLDQGNLADVVFGINKTVEGINDIVADESNAPAYNLQGVRVNGAAKGLIIRDGKKQIVK